MLETDEATLTWLLEYMCTCVHVSVYVSVWVWVWVWVCMHQTTVKET